ncbi:MAG: hypothetical protein WBC62_07280, partial [Candidatus Macondimonas sp.]
MSFRARALLALAWVAAVVDGCVAAAAMLGCAPSGPEQMHSGGKNGTGRETPHVDWRDFSGTRFPVGG